MDPQRETAPPEQAATDPYMTEVCQWWHLSRPSPELIDALEQGWLAPPGRVLDLGCGLGTELAFLAHVGFTAVGVDLSAVAVRRAQALHRAVRFVRADVRHLPFAASGFAVILDRGCFHYLIPPDRSAYAAEVRRLLQPHGRLLLRACLRTAGVPNDIDARAIYHTFAGWRVHSLEQVEIPSDTRSMPVLVALLESPT